MSLGVELRNLARFEERANWRAVTVCLPQHKHHGLLSMHPWLQDTHLAQVRLRVRRVDPRQQQERW